MSQFIFIMQDIIDADGAAYSVDPDQTAPLSDLGLH